MRRVCVFCGSNLGDLTEYAEAARAMGRALVERDLELVFGGGRVGLMGVLADTVLEHGGRATGVIPRALEVRELAHGGLNELHVVSTMHERKAMREELCWGTNQRQRRGQTLHADVHELHRHRITSSRDFLSQRLAH